MVLDVFEGARHGYKLFGADRGCFEGVFLVLRKLHVSAQYVRIHDKEIYIYIYIETYLGDIMSLVDFTL